MPAEFGRDSHMVFPKGAERPHSMHALDVNHIIATFGYSHVHHGAQQQADRDDDQASLHLSRDDESDSGEHYRLRYPVLTHQAQVYVQSRVRDSREGQDAAKRQAWLLTL